MRNDLLYSNLDIPQLKQALTYYSRSKSPIIRGKSQQLKIDKSMHLDKLKLRLTQYLGHSLHQKFVDNKSQNIGQSKLKRVIDGRHLKAKRISRREVFKKNHISDEKSRKKKQLQKNQDIKKMYRKSFTIKEINLQPKNKQVKQYLNDPKLGKNFGTTYYQLVALEKKFDKSHYFQKNNRHQHLIHNYGDNSLNLKNRYDYRINPEKWTMQGKKLQHRDLIMFKQLDGQILQPWKFPEQNLLEFQD